jgi:hypothetical protein
MVDIAVLEAEALTALRQYQEALKAQIMEIIDANPFGRDRNELVERFVVDYDEANNLARQAQQAAMRQALGLAALAQTLLGLPPP